MTAWEPLPGGEESLARSRRITEDVFMEDDFFGVQNDTGLPISPNGPGEPGPDARSGVIPKRAGERRAFS